MRTRSITCLMAAGLLLFGGPSLAQSEDSLRPAPRSVISQSLTPPAFPAARVQASLFEFPLAKGDEKYRSIDGHKMHQYVVEMAEISRHYRDNGHPKFWGRIIGTSAETETNEWLAAKFRSFGISDVRTQPLDLAPQWMPQDWDVAITSNGKTIHLTSAQPDYEANPLPQTELDAVYAGLGTEADFQGKDVRGKAVFVYSMQGLPNLGAVRRADQKGAAAIFEVSMLPGNMHFEAYPSGTTAPAFTLGNDDGAAARQMIEAAKAGEPVKVRASLDVKKVPNLKTALVWATLPGASDERIYVTAHKDGWFDGSSDNAGGVASMLGIAEYYAKIPKAQRPRTLVFIGIDGHHNGREGGVGDRWIASNGASLFAKAALLINDEHPATIQTQSRPRYYPGDELAWADTAMPLQWYAGGKTRPQLEKIAWNAFREFGVPVELDASPSAPASDITVLNRDQPNLESMVAEVDAGEYHNYFHTDWETPEVVPWTGLQAVTRAFAKIIDETNKVKLTTLKGS